jgi:hypothetical protein
MKLPAITELQIPSPGYLIRFLWIDTDADVSCYWLDRFLARGCFVSELNTLRDMTKDLPPASVTVLCLHHSQAKGGYSLALDIESRKALDNFIIDKDVSVLLCGHIHNPPLVKAFTATNGSKSRQYLEARCGTTTQSDFFDSPFYWKTFLAPFGIKPKRWSNSLLVHRLVEENGGLYWETELLQQRPREFSAPVSLEPEIVIEPRFRLI